MNESKHPIYHPTLGQMGGGHFENSQLWCSTKIFIYMYCHCQRFYFSLRNIPLSTEYMVKINHSLRNCGGAPPHIVIEPAPHTHSLRAPYPIFSLLFSFYPPSLPSFSPPSILYILSIFSNMPLTPSHSFYFVVIIPEIQSLFFPPRLREINF